MEAEKKKKHLLIQEHSLPLGLLSTSIDCWRDGKQYNPTGFNHTLYPIDH